VEKACGKRLHCFTSDGCFSEDALFSKPDNSTAPPPLLLLLMLLLLLLLLLLMLLRLPCASSAAVLWWGEQTCPFVWLRCWRRVECLAAMAEPYAARRARACPDP
jgi:hypothetical protein